jgi:uncharacterized protein YegL
MKNYTDLNIILDRSGSMASIANDITGGIQTFLEKEKNSGDSTKVSFYQFDDQYETVFIDKDITEDINIRIYPRGSTALLDAIGKTMATVGEKLAKMAEEERPNRVLFLIITDGFENASREFTTSTVSENIKHQREKYAWDFVFLGAGEEAVLKQHQDLGITSSSSRGFARDSASISDSFYALSNSYTSYKTLDRTDLRTYCDSFTFEEKEDDKKAVCESQ